MSRTWGYGTGRNDVASDTTGGLTQLDHPITTAAVNRNHPDDPKWLFPGGFPGRPARDGLYRGLRDHLHIHLRRARSAALAHLAGEIPAAVLAQLLDLNINTALAWANYAQNDWTTYLAARTPTPGKTCGGNE